MLGGQGAGGELPEDKDNLVFKALTRAFEHQGQEVPSLSLRLVNNIPHSPGGMGSSAAAIVGGLMAAQQLLEVPLSQEEMLKLALELEGHPDNISAALLGGLVISCGSDDKTHYFKTQLPNSLELVVAGSGIQVVNSGGQGYLASDLNL